MGGGPLVIHPGRVYIAPVGPLPSDWSDPGERGRRIHVGRVRAGDLLQAGFRFVKDGYDGEVAEHYSVELGEAPGIDDAERFVEQFEKMRRPSPWR